MFSAVWCAFSLVVGGCRARGPRDRHFGICSVEVIMVGPCETGKSTIANVLAENAETASEAYRPTVGVRILEFEGEATCCHVAVHTGGGVVQHRQRMPEGDPRM